MAPMEEYILLQRAGEDFNNCQRELSTLVLAKSPFPQSAGGTPSPSHGKGPGWLAYEEKMS